MQRLALLVGNNEYSDTSLSKLVSPPHDIFQLGELLRAPDIGGFDQVDVLENQPFPTVRRSIASFFTGKNRDDLLLLYFSGHGVLDDNGQLYLAVKDTERELLSATAIEATFITGMMDRSISRRQVLVLDCCHSGAFGRSKGMLGASVGTATTFEGKGYGRIILTASDATQYAWDGDDLVGDAQTSVFTRYLVEGLRTGEADTDADGLITLDELYDFVYEKVITETPNQTPAKWSYKQQGTIVIAQNPSPVIQPADLPEELLLAAESPFAGIRQGAVQDLQRLLQSSDRGLVYAAQTLLQKMTQDDSRTVSAAARDALAGAEPGLSQAAPGALADAQAEKQIMPALSPKEIQPATSTTTEKKRRASGITRSWQGTITRILANPYGFVAVCWSLTYIASLIMGQMVYDLLGYLVVWAAGGFITGAFLFSNMKANRWWAAIMLAAFWSLPQFYFIGLAFVLDLFSINISEYTYTLLFIFGSFTLVGIGSSLAIQISLRNSNFPAQDEH